MSTVLDQVIISNVILIVVWRFILKPFAHDFRYEIKISVLLNL